MVGTATSFRTHNPGTEKWQSTRVMGNGKACAKEIRRNPCVTADQRRREQVSFRGQQEQRLRWRAMEMTARTIMAASRTMTISVAAFIELQGQLNNLCTQRPMPQGTGTGPPTGPIGLQAHGVCCLWRPHTGYKAGRTAALTLPMQD